MNDTDEKPIVKARRDFLIKDYELKINYLTNQYTRMWTRFNYFVTIETAIIGGKLLWGENPNSYLIAFLGLGVSLIWYVVGAQDRFLVRVYKTQVSEASEKVANVIWAESECDQNSYSFVGDIDRTVEDTKKDSSKKYNLENELSGWRNKRFSITKLASLIPLSVLLIWLLVIIFLYLAHLGCGCP